MNDRGLHEQEYKRKQATIRLLFHLRALLFQTLFYMARVFDDSFNLDDIRNLVTCVHVNIWDKNDVSTKTQSIVLYYSA